MKEDFESIDFKVLPSSELVEYIALKEVFVSEARQAFTEFCFRFESDIKRKSEIYCKKFLYNEVIALEIAHCTFARVWKYPTFKAALAKSKDIDTAILLWMYPILYNQIIAYGSTHSCAEITEEEDLNVISNLEELINHYEIQDVEKKREISAKMQTIDRSLEALSDKHKIIYYTYTAFHRAGKKLPRSVTKLLREKLKLTQKSVNTYYGDAKKHIDNYLNFINEKA